MDDNDRQIVYNLLLSVAKLGEKVTAHIEHSQRAIDKAEIAVNERLAGMNEFRQTLRDQTATFITKEVYDGLVKDVQELKESRAELRGMATQASVNRTQLMAIIGIAIGIIGLILSLMK